MSASSILFIAPTRIGDAVLAASILRHIADTQPNARVTIATSPLAAPLYEGFPQLERIIYVVKRTYNRHWLHVWRQAIGTVWHSIWDTRGSLVTYGLRAGKRYWYTRQRVTLPKINLFEMAFKIPALPSPMLWPLPQHETEAARLLPDGQRFIVFGPMANWLPKEWPLDYYITLAKTLLDGAYKGYRPVIICSAQERPRALPMLEALSNYHPVDMTDGTAHLLTTYAVMQRAQGFVGNDSGLMHMACAAGTSTIGLFGPTPNIGAEAPHIAYLYAPEKDLAQLTPDVVAQAFTQLVAVT